MHWYCSDHHISVNGGHITYKVHKHYHLWTATSTFVFTLNDIPLERLAKQEITVSINLFKPNADTVFAGDCRAGYTQVQEMREKV